MFKDFVKSAWPAGVLLLLWWGIYFGLGLKESALQQGYTHDGLLMLNVVVGFGIGVIGMIIGETLRDRRW